MKHCSEKLVKTFRKQKTTLNDISPVITRISDSLSFQNQCQLIVPSVSLFHLSAYIRCPQHLVSCYTQKEIKILLVAIILGK